MLQKTCVEEQVLECCVLKQRDRRLKIQNEEWRTKCGVWEGCGQKMKE